MADTVTPTDFHMRVDLPDWRVPLRGIEASFRAESFERGTSFWVLADLEGTEACVCTWQDRD